MANLAEPAVADQDAESTDLVSVDTGDDPNRSAGSERHSGAGSRCSGRQSLPLHLCFSHPIVTAAAGSASEASSTGLCESGMISNSDILVRVQFEVFGKVQGVFFRKFTHGKAIELGLVGWCKNLPSGTVQGVAEGSETKVAIFKEWVSKTGSPRSRITKCEFSGEEIIPTLSFSTFEIRK